MSKLMALVTMVPPERKPVPADAGEGTCPYLDERIERGNLRQLDAIVADG
jgi:hypothetical protein